MRYKYRVSGTGEGWVYLPIDFAPGKEVKGWLSCFLREPESRITVHCRQDDGDEWGELIPGRIKETLVSEPTTAERVLAAIDERILHHAPMLGDSPNAMEEEKLMQLCHARLALVRSMKEERDTTP